ncbi:hypothetical protein BKA67DRAFT_583298 [Truncatella angustata]|uniref:Uncharacterized protein n=1 Tax=Truncatella angustata TaxID=152316 RepID=A0A9P8RKT0_9PEZI|nr:uncharacterized protein BKA67DRAFT_583298 [Truncatella angustata]KAH6646123.1 hypothetical protein BKA67DRAFT_583298 [Truncatella angustata]
MGYSQWLSQTYNSARAVSCTKGGERLPITHYYYSNDLSQIARTTPSYDVLVCTNNLRFVAFCSACPSLSVHKQQNI